MKALKAAYDQWKKAVDCYFKELQAELKRIKSKKPKDEDKDENKNKN